MTARHILALALLAGLLCPLSSRAATFDVNDTGDGADASLADGVCQTAGGACTLRAAIQQANNDVASDDITFSTPAGSVISVGSALVITQAVVITGPGAAQLAVDAGGITGPQVRVFIIDPGIGASPAVVVSNMTIRGGYVDRAPRNGGGMLVGVEAADTPDVTLAGLVFTGNEAVAGGGNPSLGGGLYVQGGTLYASGCSFTANTLSGNGNDFAGAGVYVNAGTVTLDRCRIDGNRMPEGPGVGLRVRSGTTTAIDTTIHDNVASVANGPQAWGGGVAVGTGAGTAGNFVARRCTFSANKSDQGGGIFVITGNATLTNCTVSGNMVDCHGAGLRADDAGSFTLNNCTITGNRVTNNRPGCYGNGGGIFTESGPVTLSNTIVAGNLGWDSRTNANFPNDVGGNTTTLTPNVTSLGYNLFGVVDPAQGPFTTLPTDQAGTPAAPIDALLQPVLTDNGGFTLTQGPYGGSPALERANPGAVTGAPNCESDDQRWFARPNDADHDGSSICDVGAVEGCVGPVDADNDHVGDDCDGCPRDSDAPHAVPTDCNGDGDTLDASEQAGEECDIDADGIGDVCDCFPETPGAIPLDPVDGVYMTKLPPYSANCAWDPVVNTLGYNVYRGFVPRGLLFKDQLDTLQCFGGGDIRLTNIDDTLDRPQGLFFYVVSSFCIGSESSLGQTSNGSERWPPPFSRPACPESARDTDGDGVQDAADNCPTDANPTQADTDGDFIGNACDSCVLVFDPGSPNTDGDTYADGCDCDVDGDGVQNAGRDPSGADCAAAVPDNCKYVVNAVQTDGDADGAGDACDNCPGVSNASQSNLDGDTCGDACDAIWYDPLSC